MFSTAFSFVLLAGLTAGEEDLTRLPEAGPPAVYFIVYVVDIQSISSNDQSFKANVFYRLRWNDPRLKDPGGNGSIRSVDEVWVPEVQIVNQQKLWKTMAEQVHVSPEGEVIYRQRVWGTFSQPLDLHEFPFDKQSFAIEFVLAGTIGNDINLLPDPAMPSGMASRLSLADWKIRDFRAKPETFEPLPGQASLSGFSFSFDAERMLGYYFFKILLPLVLIVMMSWLVFWIDPTQPNIPISMSVTSILTLIAYRFMISSFLPSISYLTRLDELVLGATVLVFAALLEVIYASSLVSRGKPERALAVDRKCRVAFPVLFAALFVVTFLI